MLKSNRDRFIGEGTFFKAVQHLLKGIVQLIDKNTYSLSLRKLDEDICTILWPACQAQH